jgi:hypothetical protein
MEPLQVYAALFTTVFFNAVITGAIVSYYHDKTRRETALRLYQGGLIAASDLNSPRIDQLGFGVPLDTSPDEPSRHSPRQPLAPDTAAYDEIFKSVRGKC